MASHNIDQVVELKGLGQTRHSSVADRQRRFSVTRQEGNRNTPGDEYFRDRKT
jgi:hypothetical protein